MFDSRTGLLRGAIQKELSSSAFRVRYLEASLLVPGVPWASGANLDPGTVEDGQRMTDAKTGNVDAVLEGGPYAVLVLGPAGSAKWDTTLRELPRVMADNRWPTATAFHVVSSALVRQLSPNWHELTNLARKRGLRGLSDLWDGFFREPAKRFRGDLLTGLLGTQRNVVLFDTAAADLASPGAGMAKGATKALIERLSTSGYEVVVMSVYASEQQCEKRAHGAIGVLASNPSSTKSSTPLPLPLPQDHDRLGRERERNRATRPPAASANTIEGVEGRPYNGRTWPLAVLGIVDVVNWCRREWPKVVGKRQRSKVFYLFDMDRRTARTVGPRDGLHVVHTMKQERRYGGSLEVTRDWTMRDRVATILVIRGMWDDRGAPVNMTYTPDGPAGPEATADWMRQVAAAAAAAAANDRVRAPCRPGVASPVWACKGSFLEDDGEEDMTRTDVDTAMGRANGILEWQANEKQQRQVSAQKAAFQAKVDKASEELKVETAKSDAAAAAAAAANR